MHITIANHSSMGECMNKFYFPLFWLLFLANLGCVPPPPPAPKQVLLIEVQSTNCSSVGDFLNYENDTIRVAYAFWAENGKMGIFIYNKSDKPIYIDWKKCSFIIEGTKQDYWQDITTMNSSSSSSVSGYSESQATSATKSWFTIFLKSISGSSKSSINNVSAWQSETFSSSTSIMTRPERITFIPPHTTICKADFSIVNNDFIVKPTMEKDTTLRLIQHSIEMPITIKPKNHRSYTYYIDTLVTEPLKVHLSFSQFSKEDSPLSFRSYITYSTDEKFLSEAYVNSQFYVAKITQMSISTFDLKSALNANRIVWATPHSFYVFKTLNETP